MAELLIVVVIIAVLVAIAVVVFFRQLEKSKQTVDLANMRQAYSAAQLEWMTSGGKEDDIIYYYNGTNIVKSNDGITGYGKSSKDASTFSDSLPVPASGIPNRNGNPCYITVRMNKNGVDRLMWGGAYTGKNVTSPEEFSSLPSGEKLKRDILLVDSLQDEFRNMTYGDLREMFMDSEGKIKDGFASGKIDDYLCVTIAYGTVNSKGLITTGKDQTNIFVPDIFENVGFDTNLKDNETYIINSVADTTNTIWVNLRIKEKDLKNLTSDNPLWNKKATTAYTYVKSGGATTPDELREVIRKKK